jgi:hypothetical protein
MPDSKYSEQQHAEIQRRLVGKILRQIEEKNAEGSINALLAALACVISAFCPDWTVGRAEQ